MLKTRDDHKAIIHIVDDEKATREGLAELLLSPRQTTRTYSSAEEFLREYEDDRHGCLILDMIMGGMSGLALVKILGERQVMPPVIVLTARPEWPVALEVMKRGAFDYIEKPIRNLPAFRDLVERAVEHDFRNRTIRLKEQDMLRRLSLLTPRERQVLDNIVDDKSSAEVAEAFGLSQKTVEYHRANVLLKMGVKSTIQLVRLVCSIKPREMQAVA